MPILLNVLEGVSGLSLSLGVGASTFALVFFFMGMRSEAFREAGRPFSRVVFVVLRVAMALILAMEVAKVVLYLYAGIPFSALLEAEALLFFWTLIAVLYGNAILMTLHLMPMRLGPALQATSWYTLGTIATLPVVTFGYLPLLLIYLACVILAAAGIEIARRRLVQG